MTTIKAMRLASVVTAINVLVASGFSIVGIIHPQYRGESLQWLYRGRNYKMALKVTLFPYRQTNTIRIIDAIPCEARIPRMKS